MTIKWNEGSKETVMKKTANEESKNKTTNRANDNGKEQIKRAIAELRTSVYCYGCRNQAEFYTKTTEAIGDYVGRVYNKDMKNLVINGKELSLTEPTEPSGTAT